MPNETLDASAIAEHMLKDYARAVCDLAAANKQLNILFEAMHKSGLTEEPVRTGFSPALHQRLIQEYSFQLRSLDPDEEKA